MSTITNIAMKVIPNRLFQSLRVLKKTELYAPFEAVTYNQDGLVTEHNCDFMKDEAFRRAYQLGESTNSWLNNGLHWQIQWRVHTILWAAARAKNMEGDFVECGVNKGGFSRAIVDYIKFDQLKDKKFYLLDTYKGLSERYVSKEEVSALAATHTRYEECYEEVKQTFEPFENVVLVRGEIPGTLSQVKSEKVCYLSIDMNCTEPEIAAADFFWDKLVSGAAIVLDDYGFPGHISQKQAFDEFAKRRNVPLLSLPTGQGLILKP